MSNDKTYNVGYRRPPPASRFKPGQSGNPKGRQRGAKNFATELADELQEKITVRDGGRELRITKQRALIKATIALRGDTRAAQILVLWVAKTTGVEPSHVPQQLNGNDEAILAAFVARQLPHGSGGKLADENITAGNAGGSDE